MEGVFFFLKFQNFLIFLNVAKRLGAWAGVFLKFNTFKYKNDNFKTLFYFKQKNLKTHSNKRLVFPKRKELKNQQKDIPKY